MQATWLRLGDVPCEVPQPHVELRFSAGRHRRESSEPWDEASRTNPCTSAGQRLTQAQNQTASAPTPTPPATLAKSPKHPRPHLLGDKVTEHRVTGARAGLGQCPRPRLRPSERSRWEASRALSGAASPHLLQEASPSTHRTHFSGSLAPPVPEASLSLTPGGWSRPSALPGPRGAAGAPRAGSTEAPFTRTRAHPRPRSAAHPCQGPLPGPTPLPRSPGRAQARPAPPRPGPGRVLAPSHRPHRRRERG